MYLELAVVLATWYMSSNLIDQRDYTELSGVYQLKLPLGLGGLIPEDDSTRLLCHELEKLDLYKALSGLLC